MLEQASFEFDAAVTESFGGNSLLDIDSHQLSFTDFIHNANKPGQPVNPEGAGYDDIRFDIAAVQGRHVVTG
ncbi:hypothetical protein ACFQL4_00445 [Halosimplex aquaticum]